MQLERPLNIFFAVDKNYVVHFSVTLISILENNKDLDIIVYIIHDFEDTSILEKIVQYNKNKYAVNIVLLKVDNAIFDNFHISLYVSKATYFRLLLADIIPSNVDSGLYIDCDTVVTGSLRELVKLSFRDEKDGDYYLIAVADPNQTENINRLDKLGIKTTRYFNAGVIFINLKKWRSDHVSDELIKIAEEYKKNLVWWDQDVLNIYFKDNCGKLDGAYNVITHGKLDQMPLIIHYSGSSKPWQYLNHHPYKSVYRKYLKLTAFKNEKFENITLKMVVRKYINMFKRLVKIDS